MFVGSSSTILSFPRPYDGVIREPLPKSTRYGLKVQVYTDKGKGKMLVVVEESFFAGPKSSVQTAIDIHMEEVDQTTEADISYFDE